MPAQVPAVRASEPARVALRELARTAGDLVIVQSAGCCGGSAPMVLLASDYPLADADVQVGVIERTPVVINARELAAWDHGDMELDVEPGYADGFSFPAGDGLHFIARFTPCPATTKKETS